MGSLPSALTNSATATGRKTPSSALVLELVEGPTLAERIAGGPISVDETIAIARQIVDALEAGHEAGIVHRDLKPANVKVRDDGTVEVLDYGLAKALEGEATGGAESELSQSPTLTRQRTQVGVILGTAAYMSPEQAKGKRVDKRTDVWASGAVVYRDAHAGELHELLRRCLEAIGQRVEAADKLPDDPAVTTSSWAALSAPFNKVAGKAFSFGGRRPMLSLSLRTIRWHLQHLLVYYSI